MIIRKYSWTYYHAQVLKLFNFTVNSQKAMVKHSIIIQHFWKKCSIFMALFNYQMWSSKNLSSIFDNALKVMEINYRKFVGWNIIWFKGFCFYQWKTCEVITLMFPISSFEPFSSCHVIFFNKWCHRCKSTLHFSY